MQAAKPKATVRIEGRNLGLLFDVNNHETKKGIKLHFILDEQFDDVRQKQALASKISTALQKKFGEAGIVIDYDERSPYDNAISYIVPLQSISEMLLKALKG
jgi:predicted secreted protein